MVDVRFVSATNKNLETAIRAGTFRQDLFFRLSGVTVTIPPLRDRREEIEPLAALFAARAAAEVNKPAPAISIEARGWLEVQPWPGNVRQLRNVVERAVLLCRDSVIGIEHLDLEGSGAPAQPTSSGEGLRSEMELFERQRIVDALQRCGNNQTLAAKMLGISRRTLIERLDAYDLPRPRKKRTAPG